ncbi:hypothetical protein BKA64DRAFT_128038 [Cadophora sp. MPI-SDFR-AT-0126]|nr:hypothetical protein BKA64DRAFT_128038 [Leotiomycetes sp. MPI-SDFR-AT-0126]
MMLGQKAMQNILKDSSVIFPPQIDREGDWKLSTQQYDAIVTRIEEHGMSLAAVFQSLRIQNVTMNAQKSAVHDARAMYNMPQRASHGFISRNELLQNVSSKLEAADGRNRLALYGLGGIGKSYVALEYAFRMHKRSPDAWIFWLNGTTESTFLRDYTGIAGHAKLFNPDESYVACIDNLKEWLESKQSRKWLMIVDNVDDDALLEGNKPLIDMIPGNLDGSVIVTTRNKQVAVNIAPARNIIQVPALDGIEGLSLLDDFLRVNETPGSDSVLAKELLSLLEYQPLAIRCAGSFMCTHSLSISSYLNLYKESEQEKLRLLNSQTSSCRPSILAPTVLTFMISFDQIKNKDPLAADLLSFMGCISNRDIRRCLLPFDNTTNCTTKFGMATAIGLLKAYSLITADPEDTRFHMHSLVHLGVRQWLRQNGRFDYWTRAALLSLSEAFPSNPDIDLGNMPLCDDYMPHVEAIFTYEEASKEDASIKCSLAHKMSRYCRIRGRLERAEKFAKVAADLCSENTPEFHVKLEAYANVLRDNGKYSKALQIERRVLEDRLRMFGDNHKDILSSRNNIALSIQCSGDYQQAEEMHRFVLNQRRLTLGYDHQDTMSSLNNMAYVLQQQKKYSEAEQFAEEAVKAKRRVYGRNHSSTLQSMSSLAIVLQERGEVDRALAIHEKVLQGRERTHGKNHPHVLRTITNMIGAFVQQGHLERSESMARDVLGTLSQIRGANHPEFLAMQHNLAWILFKLGKHEESEALARETLRSRKNIFGNSHPSTSSTQELLDELSRIDEQPMAPKSSM